MSDDKVLSQDEVDALTNAVEEGDVSTDEVSEDGEYRVHDFNTQERIVRTQYPVLSRIHERFAKKLSANMYSLISRETEINNEDIVVTKFGEFVAGLAMPSSINIVRFHPLRGKAFVIMNDDLVFALVENYFGGDCRYKSTIEEREFTLTEQRITQLIIDMVYSNLCEAWTPIMKLEIETIGYEMNPQLLNVASADDLMVKCAFNLKFEEIEGQLTILIPYTMLEPIREQLDLGASRTDDEIDPNWVRSLQDEVLDASVELSSTLTETMITLRNVLNLKAGDVIPVEMPEIITLKIEDIPSYHAKYGLSSDKCALKIIDKVKR